MTVAAPAAMVGKRYHIHEEIGKGGMGIVYRATDRLSGQEVALKRVVAAAEQLVFDTIVSDGDDMRVALAQEFKMLATLRHPHIISVLDYGFDQGGQPYFVMELLPHAKNFLDAGKDLPVNQKVELLIQILQALAYLHRRGIMHRDLKPANVMVVDGKVKLLDFGLSVAQGQKNVFDSTTVGTLYYMAPETLSNGIVSPASDLFATGIIAYQLLTGEHPFDAASINGVIDNILTAPPNLVSLDLDPRLMYVLGRLLEKDPAQRYQSATEILTFYAESTNQPVILETAATRESFLQAAQFVGRRKEFAQLSHAFNQTLQGRGSSWLIGGESGVGKSRLLEELRTQALVDGALVVRGQTTDGSQVPYEMWRDPLRWLSLEADLNDLEVSVLKSLVPDISRLLDRHVPDAPELDAQSAQDRLVNVIETVIRNQHHPLLIILEDLHWISSESMRVLGRLVRIIEDLPVMIVASFRDDEAPSLPADLPRMTFTKLHRLSDEDIAALCESMIGEAGRTPHVVDFLKRETEGNVFFIVEVVRALAQEAGNLKDIANMTLPEKVVSGGVERIVNRRLESVPEDARDLLKAAAVLGRRLDRLIMETIQNQQPQFYPRALDTWLEVCSNAAVLEVQDGEWTFAHDKLREGLLATLSPEENRQMNLIVAQAIETAYPNNPAYTPSLANHWTLTDNSAKAVYYLDLAGEQAVANFANTEAIQYLTLAMAMDTEPLSQAQTNRLIRRENALAQALLGAGRLEESRTHLKKALDLLRQPMPTNTPRMILSLLRQTAVQIGHRFVPSRLARYNESDGAHLINAARIYEKLSELYYYDSETLSTLYCSIRMLNLAERVEPSPELVRSYGNLKVATSLVGLSKLAEVYHTRAFDTLQQINEPLTESRIHSRAALADAGAGNWERARQLIERSVAIANQNGDPRQWGEANAIYLNVLYHQGELERTHEICATLRQASVHTGDRQHLHWGLLWGMNTALLLNRLEEAITLAQDTIRYLDEGSIGKLDTILDQGSIARVFMRQGLHQQARSLIDLAFPSMGQSPKPASFAQQDAFTAKAEIYLTLLDSSAVPPADLITGARDGWKLANAFSKRFPMGQPRAHLLRGWLAHIEGHPDQAHHLWDKGLEIAQQLHMPVETAHLHYHKGRHLPLGTPQRAQHLKQAIEIYQSINAQQGVAQAELAAQFAK